MIEKVHGLQSTSITLDQRFTMLAAATPFKARNQHPTVGDFLNQRLNNSNRNLVEEIARHLEQRAKQQAIHNRVGRGGLRRFGSESSLPGLRRANSVGNLSQYSGKTRASWRQSNGNISNRSRSVSMSSAPEGRGRLRNFRRRGGGQRPTRGRFRGNLGVRQGGINSLAGGRITRNRGVWVKQRLGVGRGRATRGQGARGRGGQRGQGARGQGGRGRGTRRGQANQRGQGSQRGGISRPTTPKPVPTKEELDAQLDQYMSGTKAALDKELEEYMKSAMDTDE